MLYSKLHGSLGFEDLFPEVTYLLQLRRRFGCSASCCTRDQVLATTIGCRRRSDFRLQSCIVFSECFEVVAELSVRDRRGTARRSMDTCSPSRASLPMEVVSIVCFL